VTPLAFLATLRHAFPQFTETGPGGVPSQQDAEECWSGLLNQLRGATEGISAQMADVEGDEATRAALGGGPTTTSAIATLFELELDCSLTCEETGEEWHGASQSMLLKCNIDQTVNHVSDGIRLGLTESREMTSPSLGRISPWNGMSRISRLPPWLTVQQMRFYYKADVQQKAKILRKVAFPVLLDLYEYATPVLQSTLDGPRAAWQVADDRRLAAARLQAQQNKKARTDGPGSDETVKEGGATAAATATATNADVDMKETKAEEEIAAGEELVVTHAGRATGRYELEAVLTHKGRSADSGHYVAWCRQSDGKWALFDDEDVTVKSEEEILALSGGGDWHMAYLLLYRAQTVPRS
jgi:ubiquitin carboxyl-terminal hydrolase 14